MNISLHATTVLSCTAIAQFIDWNVNGRNVKLNMSKDFKTITTMPHDVTQIENHRISRLMVTGSPDSNGTNITCTASNIIPILNATESDPALILVQGINRCSMCT